jgi:hypothetical protein
MAMKVSDAWTVPLCPECHSEFDQGRKWTRDEKRAMFLEWLAVTIDRLARDGKVKA